MTPSSRVETINRLLQSTSGRDQLMGVCQFLPGVLQPMLERTGNHELATSLKNLAALAGQYRAVTRLSGTFSLLSTAHKKELGTTPESIFATLSWLCNLCFFPSEAAAVLSGQGVTARALTTERKKQFGPRAVYFWFWSLVFEQLSHIAALLRLQKSGGENKEDTREKMNRVLGKWVQSFLWFVIAWAGMPQDGSTVRLLENPSSSILQPLHLLVEKTTVPGIQVGPWAQAMCGFTATAIAINDILKQ